MDESAKAKRQARRRRQILGATLRLLRKHGSAISTAQIAAESNCSKETLYGWFGDRDGIFTALAEEQGEAMSLVFRRGLTKVESAPFPERLTACCVSLLDIVTGEALIAINRVAMAEACRDRADLGLTILDDWQARISVPVLELIEEGQLAGDVRIDDAQAALETLLGLLIGDRQRRLLLGEDARPEFAAMEGHAKATVRKWIRLYAV